MHTPSSTPGSERKGGAGGHARKTSAPGGRERAGTRALPGLVLLAFASATGSADGGERRERALAGQLERVAETLSIHLENAESRMALVAALKASPRKYLLTLRQHLEDTLRSGGGESPPTLDAAAREVLEAERMLAEAGHYAPRIDVKVPVRAHRERLGQATTLHVAAAPLTDESETRSIVAFTAGKRTMLDAAKPPAVPVLVVTPGETAGVEPPDPLTIVDEPGEEVDGARIVDDRVGVVYLRLLDDHESWVSGDPEIYVRIGRCFGGRFRQTRHELRSVNDEHVWYWLGDRNSTHRFVDCGSRVYFNFYEADSFPHGGDDYVGSCEAAWRDLPFSGYRPVSCWGDVRAWADRD